ncbi:MAG: hypothetical protein K8U03_02440 [Planctomycetia bacterium]|nr:hypothetical protein [Planctomycetia bacterium]
MRHLSITFLTWYVCGMFMLLALLSSAITYVPSAQWIGAIFGLGSITAALTAAAAAIVCGRLPSTHWVHTSRPLFVGSLVAATAATLLFLVIV